MKVTKKILTLLVVCSCMFCSSVKESYAATINATSASYSDVRAAITAANSGDTVAVPSGSATWSSQLAITKGIILQGAGFGSTVITGNVGSRTYLIKYAPPNPSLDEKFRITGFTFDLNSNSPGINITLVGAEGGYPGVAINNVRIDHNSFLNCVQASGGNVFTVNGPIYGVVDNNTFTGDPSFDIYGYNSANDWDTSAEEFSYGTAKAMYFEDNTIGHVSQVCTTGHGGRSVFRYNTFNFTYAGSTLLPLLDWHGNQYNCTVGYPTAYAPRGGEEYGNKINNNGGTNMNYVYHRGGSLLVFFNQANGFTYGTAKLSEEWDDDYCPPGTSQGGQPQHVSNSYYWNNRNDGDEATYLVFNNRQEREGCPEISYYIAQNTDFWGYNASYNGTTEIGVGCGSVLPAHGTVGDGFWLSSQSCTSSNDANVGAHPPTPISGTFYKCTAPNTWTAYYTPYTYPHPLRKPSAPGNLRIINQ